MTYEEFTTLTKKECSMKEYEAANYVYMCADGLDKYEFCPDYNKHKDSKIIASLCDEVTKKGNYARSLRQELDQQKTLTETWAHQLIDLSAETGEEGMLEVAKGMIGISEVIRYKLLKDYELTKSERSYLYDALANE